MQPTENKQPAKEELIAHIRESLKTHEEGYKLGAWKKFNEKQEPKGTPFFWIRRLGGVAAVLAICFTLFLLTNNNPDKLADKVVNTNPSKPIAQQSKVDGSEDMATDVEQLKDKELLQDKAIVMAGSYKKGTSISNEKLALNSNSLAIVNEIVITDNNQVAVKTDASNQVSQNAMMDKQIDQQHTVIAETKVKPTIEEFLANETKNNGQTKEKFANNTKGKWVLGLMVAPSLGNSKELNMGYGVSMGYNFSDKLSLITGVSYNEMTASKDLPTTIGMSSILLGNNRSLAEISQKVSGLDIPLELKYSFNKSIYANIGVSAFAVLGQSRNNTFIQEVVIKGTANNTTSSTGGAAGASGPGSSADPSASKGQFANSYIVNQKTVERANLEKQNSVNYLGFYNFSVGFKRRVLKNHSLAIEPFIKLPINQVTQDNLNLLGTGLRLKVDF